MGGFAVGRWGTQSLLTERVPGFGPQALHEAFRQVPLPPPPPPRSVEGAHPSCALLDKGEAAICGWNGEVPRAPGSERGLPAMWLPAGGGEVLRKGQGTRSPSLIAKWMLFPWEPASESRC